MRYSRSAVTVHLTRGRSILHKVYWGIRVVGPVRSITGAGRLLTMRLRRPTSIRLVLASGPVLEVGYPRQLIPALVVFGDYIDPEYDLLKLIARPDWVVVDVGAAVGQFSMFIARLPVAEVHAFEPSTENVQTLATNAAINDVRDTVLIHQLALADQNTEGSFTTTENPFMSQLGAVDDLQGAEAIKVRTLSEEVRGLGIEHIDCLKVNVAGFETEVLEGALDYLAHEGASLLILLIGERSLGVYSKIAALGYRFFFFHPAKRIMLELPALDSQSINHPPWPARHVIVLSDKAIEKLARDGIAIHSISI